jgi:2-methylcitrate dehydratase PrpD
LVEEQELQPEDIEAIKIQPHPMVKFRYARENRLRTTDDYCFDRRYLFACAAHRVKPAFWHDPEVKQDPRLREFMGRVELNIVIDERDFALAQIEDSANWQMRIELVAKGKIYKEKILYLKGRWQPEEFRNTDEELVKKFTDNVSRLMPLENAIKATQTILELEGLENVADLMEIIGS